jgi:hypothetical protein
MDICYWKNDIKGIKLEIKENHGQTKNEVVFFGWWPSIVINQNVGTRQEKHDYWGFDYTKEFLDESVPGGRQGQVVQ